MILWMTGIASAACVAITGGQVHGVDGDLTLADGRVVASATGCDTFDATGMQVVPGFVEVSSQLGLIEVSLEGGTNDHGGSFDPVRAGMRIDTAYNPLSSLIPIQRLQGVTSAVTWPSGGLVSGQGAWVDLTGTTQDQSVVSPSVGMLASLGHGNSKAQAGQLLRELFEDARDYQRNKAAWERNQRRPYAPGASRLDLEALLPVLDREIPLVVGANRASDIEHLIALQKDLGIRLVIRGGAEAWLHADALAAGKIAVVVDPYVYGPGGFGQIRGRADNAALLHEAGVDVILSSNSSHNARTLRQVAGNAVRGGMDHDAAVDAISAVPARVFGRSDRGQLTPGAAANVVVFDGDPLELSSKVVALWIGGESVPLTSRQTALRDRYRTLPGSPVPGLSLPEE